MGVIPFEVYAHKTQPEDYWGVVTVWLDKVCVPRDPAAKAEAVQVRSRLCSHRTFKGTSHIFSVWVGKPETSWKAPRSARMELSFGGPSEAQLSQPGLEHS